MLTTDIDSQASTFCNKIKEKANIHSEDRPTVVETSIENSDLQKLFW